MNLVARLLAFSHRYSGWRINIFFATALTALILTVKFIILITGLCQPRDANGYHVFFEGDCSKSEVISTVWHLSINVCSTLLLAASNSGLQILNAPSREEVNDAHAQGRSFHIGILAFLNASYIPFRRTVLILSLTLSSIPLHFMYNSVVYSATASYEYDAFVVARDFLNGAPFTDFTGPNSFLSNVSGSLQLWRMPSVTEVTKVQGQAQDGQLVHLSRKECTYQFDNFAISNFSTILMVTESENKTNSILGYLQGDNSRLLLRSDYYFQSWRCGYSRNGYGDGFVDGDGHSHSCTSSELAKNETWTVYNSPYMQLTSNTLSIDHCLVRTAEPHCTVSTAVTRLFKTSFRVRIIRTFFQSYTEILAKMRSSSSDCRISWTSVVEPKMRLFLISISTLTCVE